MPARRVHKKGLKRVFKHRIQRNMISDVHSFDRMGEAIIVFTNDANYPAILTMQNTQPIGGNIGVPQTNPLGNTYGFGLTLVNELAALMAFNEFTTLFDQYKIDYVDYIIDLMIDQNIGANSTALANIPELYYVQDHDDGEVFSVLANIQEYQKCKLLKLPYQRTLKVRTYPKPATVLYQSGVVAAYGQGKSIWVDCNYPKVEHYGMKFYFDNFNSQVGNTFKIRIQPKYRMSFKNVK